MSALEKTSEGDNSCRYWAFISYSSKDKKWARWLHRSIETYGIPAQFISHPTPAGHPAPKRFHPLFHDRAELSASADLGAVIEEALRASRYLIVVCSPNAAKSKWVNKEIETFQRFHKHGRILAIIVDGEPNQGGEAECFPSALRATEPIAADARPQADGRDNAKLKLLAGMLGVTFDALKQRDHQRTLTRTRQIVALSSAIILALSLLSIGMWRARKTTMDTLGLHFLEAGRRDFLRDDIHSAYSLLTQAYQIRPNDPALRFTLARVGELAEADARARSLGKLDGQAVFENVTEETVTNGVPIPESPYLLRCDAKGTVSVIGFRAGKYEKVRDTATRWSGLPDIIATLRKDSAGIGKRSMLFTFDQTHQRFIVARDWDMEVQVFDYTTADKVAHFSIRNAADFTELGFLTNHNVIVAKSLGAGLHGHDDIWHPFLVSPYLTLSNGVDFPRLERMRHLPSGAQLTTSAPSPHAIVNQTSGVTNEFIGPVQLTSFHDKSQLMTWIVDGPIFDKAATPDGRSAVIINTTGEYTSSDAKVRVCSASGQVIDILDTTYMSRIESVCLQGRLCLIRDKHLGSDDFLLLYGINLPAGTIRGVWKIPNADEPPFVISPLGDRLFAFIKNDSDWASPAIVDLQSTKVSRLEQQRVVAAASFSSDSKLLATITLPSDGRDVLVEVWDAVTGALLLSRKSPTTDKYTRGYDQFERGHIGFDLSGMWLLWQYDNRPVRGIPVGLEQRKPAAVRAYAIAEVLSGNHFP